MPISNVSTMLQQPSHPIIMFVLFNLAESPSSRSHPLSARHDPNSSSSSALPVQRESIITPGVEKARYYYAVCSKPMHVYLCTVCVSVCLCVYSNYFLEYCDRAWMPEKVQYVIFLGDDLQRFSSPLDWHTSPWGIIIIDPYFSTYTVRGC